MILVLLLTFSFCVAKPQHGYSVTGVLKYDKNYSHFSFVNPKSPKKGEITLGEVGSLHTLNPYLSNDKRNGRIFLLEVGTLLLRSWEEPMAAYCWCAESIDVLDDGKKIVFKIRKGVEWDASYGYLTADDVIFSWKTWKQHGAVYMRNLYAPIIDIRKVDLYTVEVILKNSHPVLPIIIGGMPLLCKRYHEIHGTEILKTQPMLALGPYRVTEYKAGSFICYERRKDFWGKDIPCCRGQYNFDKITVRYFKEHGPMRTACRKKEIDSIVERDPIYMNCPMIYPEGVKGYRWEGDRPPSFMNLLFFNLRKKHFQDRRVRQAFSLLFNYQTLQKFCFQGIYKPVNSLFVRSLSYSDKVLSEEALSLISKFLPTLPDISRPFKHKSIDNYPIRVSQALSLLKKAGWEIDFMRKKLCFRDGTVFPTLHVYCYKNTEEDIARDYQKRLAAIGVTLKVWVSDAPYLQHALSSHTMYDFAFYTYVGTHFPSLGLKNVLHSSLADNKRGRNYAGIQNKAVDFLIDRMSEVKSIKEQKKVACLIDRIVLGESFCIPLFYCSEIAFFAWDHMCFPPKNDVLGYVLNSGYFTE